LHFNQRHRTAKNVARRQQCQLKCGGAIFKALGLTEIQYLLAPVAGQTHLHQLRRGRAENDFPVRRDVIGMRMADEHSLVLRFVGIQPQSKLGQVDATVPKFNSQNRHIET